MKRKKNVKSKDKKQLKPLPRSNISAPQDLEEFILEANEVKALTASPGWGIVERDLARLQAGIVPKLAYLDDAKPEVKEAKRLYIGIDKVLALINDYEANRDKAIEMLEKLENPDLAVAMDIDNE